MRGFVSYAHDDRKVCEELRKPLGMLCRIFDDIEDFWIDDVNHTGRCFRQGYRQAIAEAKIFVLLISQSSLWSEEIMDQEIPAIHARRSAEDCLVLPVIVEPCLWQSVLGTLLPSPRDEELRLKPLRRWQPITAGIHQAGSEMKEAISAHFGIQPKQLFDWTSP